MMCSMARMWICSMSSPRDSPQGHARAAGQSASGVVCTKCAFCDHTKPSTSASGGEPSKTKFVKGKTKVDVLGAGKATREEERRVFALAGLSLLKGE